MKARRGEGSEGSMSSIGSQIEAAAVAAACLEGKKAPSPTTAIPTSSSFSLHDDHGAIVQSLQHLERRLDEMDHVWTTHRDQTYDAIETIRRRLAAVASVHMSDV